jgi:zona occludens toxin (predicted ATPase)
MRLTNVMRAIWQDSKGFLLALLVVGTIYLFLFKPGGSPPAPTPTNAPPVLTNKPPAASTNQSTNVIK